MFPQYFYIASVNYFSNEVEADDARGCERFFYLFRYLFGNFDIYCHPQSIYLRGPLEMKIVLFANTDWYLYNFRLSLATNLKSQGHDVVLLSPPGEYSKKLIQMGFNWQAAPLNRRSLNPLCELRFLLWLRKWLLQQKPDLVHSFTIKCAIYGSLVAKLTFVPARVNAVAGLGYVFTSKDLRARFLRPIVRTLMRLALTGKNARLILQNPDDVRLFQKADIVSYDSIRLIMGSGVNCNRFIGNHEERKSRSAVKVLLTARLLWDKGVAEFVEAAQQLRQECGSNIHFLLAGSPDPGNPAAVPLQIVESWVNDGIVEWLGHVDDMPKLLSSVDIFVLPSYREGLPRTLIEAGACSLPLITTDVPGCREVVSQHGQNGLLVPVQDSRQLAAAIRKLYEDPDLRKRLGAAAREHVYREFDEHIVLAKTIEVYRELA
ncbi:glycosyltransferase family 4 protein [Aquitalea sp. ASV15]|uniref:glycosyltransferase family 4 protein n=1 Tax=Aquitalea sp. ASV15 TaxID=2795104 RepID=UPI0018EA680A|nr:glycosyltransferase family 4 protein [Aquitalea sp. ASV15]